MKIYRILPPLFAIAASVGACTVQDQNAADEPLGEVTQALCTEPPATFVDPITRTDFSHAYQTTISIGTGSFGTATASLPGDVTGVAEGRFPLALIIHGNGFGHTDYTALQEHLAKNGFIAVSAAWTSSEPDLADVKPALLDLLMYLHLDWAHKLSLDGRVALIGHSRGGELAARFAPDIANLWPLEALVLMAPAPNEELRDVMVGWHGGDMLALFGSKDNDSAANGINKAADPLGAHKNAFLYYDLYGPFSNEHTSLCGMPTYEKSMIFVKDVSHAAWQSDPTELPNFTTPCTNGQLSRCEDMTKGFVSAFLHWKLDDETDYIPLFQGKARPPALDPALVYQTQFSGRWRAVVDGFVTPGVGNNDAGGSVSWTNATVTEDLAPALHPESTHASDALAISWPDCVGLGCSTPSVVFDIPATAASSDASAATHLSIRAGTLDAGNVPDFHVQLISADNVASPLVPMSLYGGVAERYDAVPMVPLYRYAMSSTLIPMCAFENVDLTNVAQVRLVFDAPNHDAGDIMIDNIEFLHGGSSCE